MLGKVSLFFAALVALLAARMATKNWLIARDRLPEDFPDPQELQVSEVPVVYYDNLTHLTDFVQGFVVLRSAQPFHVENLRDMFRDEVVRAKYVNPDCSRETTVCSPCMKNPTSKDSIAFTTVGEVLQPGSGLYASFAKVSNSAATRMWRLMDANFAVSNHSMEHAFISNLQKPMITAPFHAASAFLSMSVQIEGRKTWLFVERDEYLYNWGGTPAAGVVFPTVSPKKTVKVYTYTSEPGDLFFFPATYAHTVYTHEGPNLMMNFRKLSPECIYGQPVTFAHGVLSAVANRIVEGIMGTLKKRHAEDKAPSLQPEQTYNSVAYRKLENACNARDGQAVPLDAKLIQLIKETAAKDKAANAHRDKPRLN